MKMHKKHRKRSSMQGIKHAVLLFSALLCFLLNSCNSGSQEAKETYFIENDSTDSIQGIEKADIEDAGFNEGNIVNDSLHSNTEDLSILGFVLDGLIWEETPAEADEHNEGLPSSHSEAEGIDAGEIEAEPEVQELKMLESKETVLKEPIIEEPMAEELTAAITPTDSVLAFLDGLSAPKEGKLLEAEGAVSVYYYMQTDKRWSKKYYGGKDTIGKYACGPACMSIVISSLTSITIDPVQMSKWAYDNGYWYPESGSLHSFIPDAAKAFGLTVEGIPNDGAAASRIKEALLEGKLVAVLMGKGHFTKGGHFIVLRGINSSGEILVADPASSDRTNMSWELSLIVDEARAWAGAGGPFWIISIE